MSKVKHTHQKIEESIPHRLKVLEDSFEKLKEEFYASKIGETEESSGSGAGTSQEGCKKIEETIVRNSERRGLEALCEKVEKEEE